MSETNVERARRGYEAAMRGDLDVLRELLDPDVKWHGGDPTARGSCHNRDEAIQFMRAAQARQPPGELVEIRGAGDKVVVILRPRADGDQQAPLVANLSTFRDGKVIEMVHYPNAEDALAAAGV